MFSTQIFVCVHLCQDINVYIEQIYKDHSFWTECITKAQNFFGHAYFQKSWVTGTLGLVASLLAAVMTNNQLQVAVGVQKIEISLKTIVIVISQDIATVVVQKRVP